MKKINCYALCFIAAAVLVVLASGLHAAESPQDKKGHQEGTTSTGVEISTEELKQILLTGKIPVIDVRPEKEFAISHIPGSINIFEAKIEQMMQVAQDKTSGPVLYCNGPILS